MRIKLARCMKCLICSQEHSKCVYVKAVIFLKWDINN